MSSSNTPQDAPPKSGRRPVPSTDSGDAGDAAHAPLLPMDFSTFILSLASSAMVNLGELPPPGIADKSARVIDIEGAKQMIDILGILEEKTRGNLTDAESKLLESLLYDLRVKFVDANKT